MLTFVDVPRSPPKRVAAHRRPGAPDASRSSESESTRRHVAAAPLDVEYRLEFVPVLVRRRTPQRRCSSVGSGHAQAARAAVARGLHRSRSVRVSRRSALLDDLLADGKLSAARVSFGSSKGSMVETVVYDYEPVQPLREEGSESPDPRSTSRHTFATSTPLSTPARAEPSAAERPASRVRVTYFESKKPLLVPAADPSDAPTPEEPDVPAPPPPGHTQVTTTTGEMPTTYIVQTIDAGWENPFRPGGELSKEADQIVRAIQSGRPLDASLDEADAQATTVVTGQPAHNGGPAGEPLVQATVQTSVAAAPPPPPPTAATHRNGGAAQQTAVVAQPAGTVEVQHSLVKPEDASQVEQVTLKKKPRGKCCVVQ